MARLRDWLAERNWHRPPYYLAHALLLISSVIVICIIYALNIYSTREEPLVPQIVFPMHYSSSANWYETPWSWTTISIAAHTSVAFFVLSAVVRYFRPIPAAVHIPSNSPSLTTWTTGFTGILCYTKERRLAARCGAQSSCKSYIVVVVFTAIALVSLSAAVASDLVDARRRATTAAYMSVPSGPEMRMVSMEEEERPSREQAALPGSSSSSPHRFEPRRPPKVRS